MRVTVIITAILAAIVLLSLIFWDKVKTYYLSALAFLGLCSSCNQKSATPKAGSGSAVTDTVSSGTIPDPVFTNQIAPVNEDDPFAACEFFGNHSALTPHLYANKQANELVGTVLAKTQPEFNAYGTWKNMQKVGRQMNDQSLFMWAYREPYQNATNVALRTREGCQSYADVRNTYPYSYQGREVSLPNVAQESNYEDLNLVLNMSGDLPEARATHDIYTIEVQGHHPGLMFRINGGAWQGTSLEDTEQVIGRNYAYTKIGYFQAGKDFVIDFTKNGGTTIDRFRVVRNNAGGHFGVTSTFTRQRDGRVFVHTFQADKFTPMNLSGIPYKNWGCWFDLGIKTPGDYQYQLKGETGYILDDALFVQVR